MKQKSWLATHPSRSFFSIPFTCSTQLWNMPELATPNKYLNTFKNSWQSCMDTTTDLETCQYTSILKYTQHYAFLLHIKCPRNVDSRFLYMHCTYWAIFLKCNIYLSCQILKNQSARFSLCPWFLKEDIYIRLSISLTLNIEQVVSHY